MEDFFDKIIDNAFILPLNGSLRAAIKEICDEYSSDMDVTKFESLCSLFVLDCDDNVFDEYIEEHLVEDVLISRLAKKHMAQYIVCNVYNEDVLSEEDKALCSLALRNVLVAAKSKFFSIPLPQSLTEVIDYYPKFYSEHTALEFSEEAQLVPKILNAESFDDLDDVDLTECFEEIQYYARIESRKYYNEEVIRSKNEIQVRDFNAANDVAYDLAQQDWSYIDPNPIANIITILDEEGKKKQKLVDIKEKFFTQREKLLGQNLSPSSVLLQYLVSNQHEKFLSEIKFSPIEFAIALYYEYVFMFTKE